MNLFDCLGKVFKKLIIEKLLRLKKNFKKAK